MLYQLTQYAREKGLAGRPGYMQKRIRAIVTLAANGDVQSVESSDRFVYAPNLSMPELVGKGGLRSHFLADAVSTVTGMNQDKHAVFAALHAEAAKHIPQLAPLAAALANPVILQKMQQQLAELKVKPTDVITFRLSGSDKTIVEQDFWQHWWDGHRATLQKPAPGKRMRCLATGELVVPAATQPKLKLAHIGGQGAGSTLIGFDKEAFTSFGLEQAQNAACSEEAAAVYADALTDLIQQAPRPLAGTLMLHWYDKSIPPKEDLLILIGESSESDREIERESVMQASRRLAEAVRAGQDPEQQHNRYHVILMQAEAGRAKVRSTFEGELRELYEAVKQWFDDLSIVAPRGVVLAEPPKLYALLSRMLRYRPNARPNELNDAMEDLAPLLARVWDSILAASPFPQAAASLALNNLKSRLLRAREDEREHGLENLDRIAVSILKLWYNRAVRWGLLDKGGETVGTKLNKEHPAPAYHAGRLLAVLNHLQHRALGDVNADVVQRFFSAASVTPGLVIGRLIDGAQPHLNKLRKDNRTKGLYIWYQQMISEIMSRLDDEALKQLDFAGQTLFALGYYHQFAALFEKGAKIEEEDENDGTEEPV